MSAIWARLAAAAVALLAVLGLVAYVVSTERARGAQAEHAARVQEQQAASAAAATHEAATRAAQKEVASEAQRQAARAAADHDDADAAARGVLQRALADSRREAAAAAARGAPACPVDVVPADLLRSALQEAVSLAAIADQRGIAGSACERAYDAAVTAP